MKKRGKKPVYEEPVDDATEQEVEEEFRLDPAKSEQIPQRHLVGQQDLDPRRTKVRVNLFLDLDIVECFKARAAEPNAAPFQAQINNALRAVIERGDLPTGYEQLLPSLLSALVDNENFIAAVAERVDQARK